MAPRWWSHRLRLLAPVSTGAYPGSVGARRQPVESAPGRRGVPVRLRPPGSVAGPAAQWQSPGLRREQIGDRRVGFALLRAAVSSDPLAGLRRVSVLGSAQSLAPDPPGRVGVAGGHREGVVPVPLWETAPAGRLAGLLRVSVLGSAQSLVPDPPGRVGVAGGHREGVVPVPLWET
ncbi:hypothetical protein, partial [Accumulibacter sp.]|uniref:hypothetical protein n=1 Tax=Accumulibacter sp. TaxID=2053492 RepID=UPI0033147A39